MSHIFAEQNNTVDIVIVTYNRLEFTQRCIRLINERTKVKFRIIVVDNCSDDGSQDWLFDAKKLNDIQHLILLKRNYGIHMAKNYGLALVRDSKYYIDIDNDILVPDIKPDWITSLAMLMEKYPDYAAISCRPQVLVGAGADKFKTDEVAEFNHIGAHGRIMRTDIVKKVGGWDKVFDAKRNSEDKYIASRIQDEGMKVGYARDVHCWHLFGENWGYKEKALEEHGHNDMWPPPEHYDKEFINFDHKTWEPLKD
jgi:glycosyltransferase involved in cell wall biosynthesis